MYQVHFLIPDPNAFPSGGNIYNRELLAALSRLQVHVSHSPFDPKVLMASPDTVYVLDSIYFQDITDADRPIPENCIGLIHHLESLFPLSEDRFRERELPLLMRFIRCIATSRFTERYLAKGGYPADRIDVIEPAPMLTRMDKKAPEGKVRALILGSCVPRKGQLEFLQVMAAMDIPPYYQVTIAGSLTADIDYARACADLILCTPSLSKCVTLTGEQDTDAIRQLYRKSNLFISSSHMETFGMAIQDAVACGLPVLALEGGYAAEHVEHGVNGQRCPSMEALGHAFAACVQETDAFRDLQLRAARFEHHYSTWADAALLLRSAIGV